MTPSRRSLLAIPLAAGAAPQAFAQTGGAQTGVAPSDIPVWPPAERFALWPGIPVGAPNPPPRPRPQITGRPGFFRDIQLRGVLHPEVGVFRPLRPDGRAVLVCPGGGYSMTSQRNEGIDVARVLNGFGITVFVLSYRLPGEGWADRANVPLADAQRAMRLIRANARRYAIRPEHLGVLGFSAGGHLAGSLEIHHALPVYRAIDAADREPARPAFAGLMYAVSNMDAGRSYGGSRAQLLGPLPDPAMQARYAIDRNLRGGEAPLFLVHAEDDDTVPVVNSIDLLAAARRAGIPVEAHILRRGRHGFGVRLPQSSPGSLWPQLFDRWMGEAIGPEAPL
ncbi:alpha/beta hydrolase [Sphingomonas sp. PB2P19]|uniref:alpha/beta hydrolase n=1 Tax=Sphingomonas rhamnosi TaxID=3096156 RepID=UPI002FCB97FE